MLVILKKITPESLVGQIDHIDRSILSSEILTDKYDDVELRFNFFRNGLFVGHKKDMSLSVNSLYISKRSAQLGLTWYARKKIEEACMSLVDNGERSGLVVSLIAIVKD